MDSNTYFSLVRYLTELKMPEELSEQQQAAIKRKARYFIVINNELYKKNKQNIQRPFKVVREYEVETILYNVHSDPLAGHFSVEETYRRIKMRYYWPQMFIDVRNYVKSCDECQKRGKNKRTEPLHPIKIGQPFDRVGMDIVGPLPKTKKGNTYIVVATDYLTKWPEARAIPDQKASTVSAFFYEDIICRHGCPKELLTDRGSHFVNEILRSLCQELGVKHKLSTSYHPQTNGLVERFNRTLCETLAKYAGESKDDWDLYLPSTLFAYRTKRHNTTRHEPFYLVYGREATLPIDFAITTSQAQLANTDPQQDLLNRIHHLTGQFENIKIEAQDNIAKSQRLQKERHDKQLSKVQRYKIGDLVLLYKSELKNRKKLEDRWKGPYYVHEVFPNGVYKLRTIDGKVLKVPINGDRLKQYHQRE
jgi:hypothetical protein